MIKTILFSLIIFSILISPSFVLSQPLVPTTCEGADCQFSDLVELAKNIMNFLVVISIPLSAIMFAYAGFLLITAAGSEEKIKKGHGIFGKVGIGLFFVLAAWLIVFLITDVLLKDGYSLLEGN